jgi:hypothetical protein
MIAAMGPEESSETSDLRQDLRIHLLRRERLEPLRFELQEARAHSFNQRGVAGSNQR